MPGNANGSLDGIALKPLTVAFHEPGFIARLQAENQQPFWFMMSGEQRQRAGNPMGPANPQALNRYSYVQNNPLKYTDPGGHIACPAGFAGGPVVGLLVCAAVVLAPLAIYVGFEVHDHAQQHQETAGNTAPIPPAPTPEPGGQAPQDRVLQSGGHELRNSTANALNRAHGLRLHPREWGRALEYLKRDSGLGNNHHGKIMESGDYIDAQTGKVLGNLLEYLP